MNKANAQKTALELARQNYESVAVIYTEDGQTWGTGTHQEARYLDICGPFPFDAEIWSCLARLDDPVWKCYKGPMKQVDRIAETGATGKQAELLKRLQDVVNMDDLHDVVQGLKEDDA